MCAVTLPRMSRWPLTAPLALLLACTASTPAAPTPSKPVDAPQPVTPSNTPEPPATPPTPETEPTPPTPTNEPLVSWWCVCYSRVAAVEAEKVTACRSTEKECHALERAVAAGNKGMVARSLSRPCLELKAAHPGDVHGGRERWTPSKKPGSWMSVGECRLPGDGELVQNVDTFKVMMDEKIGELSMSSTGADVVAQLGEPTRKGRTDLSEASGEMIQAWHYPDQGVTLGMVVADDKSTSIGSVTIKPPCTLKTRLGIGIGSTRKEVLDAYGKLRDPEFPSGEQEEVFLAGSIYGGVFFTFKKDVVREIFVGAGAE